MRSFIYLAFLGVVLATIAIVVRSGMLLSKHPGEPINSAMRSALAETSPQLSTEDANQVRKDFPTAYQNPSGFLDGRPFDSSDLHGGTFTFQVGTGQVIKGWDEAFLSMPKGARRTLIIPYWLGYGEAGNPPMIPARATLVFDVELVDFK